MDRRLRNGALLAIGGGAVFVLGVTQDWFPVWGAGLLIYVAGYVHLVRALEGTLGGPRVTEYTLSLLDEDHIDRQAFELRVSYRGRDRWAVLKGPLCLSKDGKWDHELLASGRDQAWIDAHRFTRVEALKKAREELPKVRVMGKTAYDVMGR